MKNSIYVVALTATSAVTLTTPAFALNNVQIQQSQTQPQSNAPILATNNPLSVNYSKLTIQPNQSNIIKTRGLISQTIGNNNGNIVQPAKSFKVNHLENQAINTQEINGQVPRNYIKIRVKRIKGSNYVPRQLYLPPHDSPNIRKGEEQYYNKIENIVTNQVIPSVQHNSKYRVHHKTGFIRPVNYAINSPYGMRRHPTLKKVMMHTGVDFAAPKGTPIRAVADGVVQASSFIKGYGKTVVLKHTNKTKNTPSISSLYGHASKLIVKPGQRVRQGDVIAYVGSTGRSTGNHLHFEILQNGRRVNPYHFIPDRQSV